MPMQRASVQQSGPVTMSEASSRRALFGKAAAAFAGLPDLTLRPCRASALPPELERATAALVRTLLALRSDPAAKVIVYAGAARLGGRERLAQRPKRVG